MSLSVTEALELRPYRQEELKVDNRSLQSFRAPRPSGDTGSHGSRRGSQPRNTLTSPDIASYSEDVQKWNFPKRNIYRLAALYWGFLIFGMTDGAYGALIPYLETYYNLNYTVVSLVFLSPFAGYTLASVFNNAIHNRFGQCGVAFLAPVSRLLCFVITSIHPPYPVLVVMYLLAGFGNGLADGAWNAWIGPMADSTQILGLLHACYGLGATIAPLIATAMITKAGLAWYQYYYLMIGIGLIELGTTLYAFWPNTAAEFRRENPRTHEGSNDMREALFTAPSARIVWLLAGFLLCYMGAEVGLGGWIVIYMIRVRKGAPFPSGMTATGYWLGLTMGRVVLGFITPRIGDRIAIIIYLPAAMTMQLIFWLVPQFYVSAIAVALQGFFFGPLFPAAMVVATRLLPRHLHVTGVAFAAAIGGTGAALLPFAIGAAAQAKGVKTIPPILFAIMAVSFVLWLLVPSKPKKRE